MKALKSHFFERETTWVAENLLGSYLLRYINGKKLLGRIVETEAYLGLEDSCCHSFSGSRTSRTQTMYLPGGYSYVYFTYGMHYCFNVITASRNEPEAVLIRAIEPLEGLSEMRKNRNKENLQELCSGPGKLCQAFNITKLLNAKKLSQEGDFYIAKGPKVDEVELDSRVGLSPYKDDTHCFLRFYIKNNPFVSLKKNQIS